ncbi:MAG: hypothetical protein PHN60_00550 [Candidatus Gracilibacteria bacterium]|nr:hypothetical protein [Candidatus Gracilibacteria bacterium]
MFISADQFPKDRENRDVSFEAYQKLPDINSPEGQLYLRNLSGDIVTKVLELIFINACPGCGRSLSQTESMCEHCGNTNDNLYDTISAQTDKHPIGRVMGTRGH